jgi:hypothetical protein
MDKIPIKYQSICLLSFKIDLHKYLAAILCLSADLAFSANFLGGKHNVDFDSWGLVLDP